MSRIASLRRTTNDGIEWSRSKHITIRIISSGSIRMSLRETRGNELVLLSSPKNRISASWHPLMILFGGQVHGDRSGSARRRQVVITLRRTEIAGFHATEIHDQFL